MCKRFVLKWSDLFNESFQKEYLNFLDRLVCIYKNYDKYSEKNIIEIGHSYLKYWTKIISIIESFLQENAILTNNTKDAVKFIIYSDVVTKGNDLYNLYRGMCNLEKHSFIIPKKYFSKKYITILNELYKFLQERLKKEIEYGLVS